MTTSNVVPFVPRVSAVSVKRIKKHWWKARTGRATFFGQSLGEVMNKFRSYRRQQFVARLRPERIADGILTRIHDERL